MSGEGFFELGCACCIANWIWNNIDLLLASCPFVCQKERTKFTNLSSIIIVVSPLNALIANQISRLNSGAITASALDVMSMKEVSDYGEPEVMCDFNYSDKQKLEIGHYNIVFVHPESVVSCVYGRKLMQSKPYQDNVCAIVVDEAHCILDCKLNISDFFYISPPQFVR